jgi:hypothetical protein
LAIAATVPFTGNQTREAAFVASLTPAQQKVYQAARQEQADRRAAFQELTASTP